MSDPLPAATSGRGGTTRPFVAEDIPQVARLHRTVFRPGGGADGVELESYRAYFRRVFLDNPACDAGLSSLVYEEEGGRITGFLGVVPRWMSMNGQRFQGAITSQFVVDPGSRTGLVAVRLAKAFLDGPQDLSIADEATDVSRRIWEGLGGTTALLHSMCWTRPLRPARLVLSLLRTRGSLAPLAVLSGPLARIADALVTRIPRSHLYQSRPRVWSDDLRAETFLTWLPEFVGVGSLRMEYDGRTFQWLLDLAEQRQGAGHLHKAVIRNKQRILGWYIYALDHGGMADVLQIAATPSSIHDVLDHLFYEAWRQGALAVSGRVDPPFLQALSDKYCLLHRRGPWLLVNARKSDLLRAFQSGDAFVSRFDGEWCLGFSLPSARGAP